MTTQRHRSTAPTQEVILLGSPELNLQICMQKENFIKRPTAFCISKHSQLTSTHSAYHSGSCIRTSLVVADERNFQAIAAETEGVASVDAGKTHDTAALPPDLVA